MYQAYECLRCGHTFDMTDKGRSYFTHNVGCVISCPKCGCYGLDELNLEKCRAGCINPETGKFLSCADCTFAPSKYDCEAYRQDHGSYQIITVNILETVY